MHFHQEIYHHLLNYRNNFDSTFNFIVRQRTSKTKEFPNGKFAAGLVFQGTNNYCFVGIIDKSGGQNATKSVGLVITPSNISFTAKLEIVFPGIDKQNLIQFYKELAEEFKGIEWDKKGTRAYLTIGTFEKDNPKVLFDWLNKYFPIIKSKALESKIEGLLLSEDKFIKLKENLESRIENDSKEVNYWVFQGNPKVYNITNALKAGHLKSWKVAAHKDKIKIGDKIILWQTGENNGCYALAEITSNVSVFEEEKFEKQYYEIEDDKSESDRVKIKIETYLADNPILWSDIKSIPIFNNFKAGNQGTNFSSTKEEFEALLQLSKNKMNTNLREEYIYYIKNINKQGSQKASSYIRALELLDEILIKKAKDKLNDLDSIFKIHQREPIKILHSFVLQEQKNENGIFENEEPISYWRDRFYSAAVNSYLDFLKTRNKNQETIKTIPTNFNIQAFQASCEEAGLTYSKQLITRYIASLATKPFVLLSGLSGSGKTKLALSFAQWICEHKNQYQIVPVGADWTNREPLLGYVNALEPTQYILPENGALQLIIEANKPENKEKPYFLILDEMNLSHVERYFADFLSVMESKESFKLHSSTEALDGGSDIAVKKEYAWPKNLFVVGTVNIDETTYMFSPKVLDRANVIEFRINDTEMSKYLDNPKEVIDLEGEGKGLAAEFVAIATEKAKTNPDDLKEALNNFFGQLQTIGAEFGYRTASEIQTLFGKIELVNESYKAAETVNEKIDIAIMQKLLPKLHGSRRKLAEPLTILARLCLTEKSESIFNDYGEITIDTSTIKYPLSFYKIARMYKSAIDNGFASYAEA